MDSSLYKVFKTSRDFDYSYYYQPASDATLPTLLFLHGFPTTSLIWSRQIPYFQNHGFGVIVPDMLGFGGSSKPTDPEDYRLSLVCNDIVELLDSECVKNSVVIGHDLGSKVASRLANLHNERFKGFAFLAVPYCAPRPNSNIKHTLYATKRMCGYELCGHTLFFAEGDSAALIQDHLDSFYNAMFPDDPKIWVTEVAPIGALKSWLEANKQTRTPSYFSEKDVRAWHANFSKQGFNAPLCWHRAHIGGINADDDKTIPIENYIIMKPVFFGAAGHDYISRSILGIATTNHHCKNATIREFTAGHWLMVSSHSEVNHALYDWIMDLV